jgi:hypothetical protein
MDNEQATQEQQVVFQEVYVPVFIEKCAERGLTFPNEQALHEGLETVALVHRALDSQQGSVIKSANHELKKSLGLDVHEAQESQASSIKQAAAGFSASPALREAILAGLQLK